MVVRDKAGYLGYPIGYVDEGEQQWVVVRWTFMSDGEPCEFVTAEHIDEIDIVFNRDDKINAIARNLKLSP